MNGVLYFIQEGNSGAIKIGWTANCPHRRLDAIQTGNSENLRLVGVLPDQNKSTECVWHDRFKHVRKRAEWFWPTCELLDAIKDLIPDADLGSGDCVLPAYRHPRRSRTPDTALIDSIDTYLMRNGTTATQFGLEALEDPNLVFQIREGRWLRESTRKRVLGFMSDSSDHHRTLQATGT